MIGVGTSLLFGKRAGKAGPPIPPFNEAMVDAWFMSGLSNNDKPSSIRGVKGNEMVLKNFAYALNSGFGKYKVDFTKYTRSNTSRNSISIHKEAGIDKGYATIFYSSLTSNIPSYSIEIKGLASGQVLYSYRDNEGLEKNISYNKDGIYTLPLCYKEGTSFSGTAAGFTINTVDAVTITQLPTAYEGALVFDGVDDYGICVGLPILDDYTVICKRKWFNTDQTSAKAIASKRKSRELDGAFIFERIHNIYVGALNYGFRTDIEISQQDVVYQTASSYNGHYALNRGTLTDTELLSLGSAGQGYEFAQCAIFYFALYNKSLTIEEIETEKERLNEEWLKRKN